MMSHGQSFKTNSETYSTCVGDHKDESMHCTNGILVSCSEPLGLMKEKIYSVLLGQSLKKAPSSVSTVVIKALFPWTSWSIHMYTYGIGD